MARATREKRIRQFGEWVTARGGELLIPTNEWELARFRGDGVTSIIYTDKGGKMSYVGQARRAWLAFEKGDTDFRFVKKTSNRYSGARRSVLVRTLLERDGPRCFYCAEEFTDALPPTREHLVPKSAAGPDNLANQLLACEPCNLEAGHLSAVEKIKLRDRKRRGIGGRLLQRIANCGSCFPESIMDEITAFLTPKEKTDA